MSLTDIDLMTAMMPKFILVPNDTCHRVSFEASCVLTDRIYIIHYTCLHSGWFSILMRFRRYRDTITVQDKRKVWYLFSFFVRYADVKILLA